MDKITKVLAMDLVEQKSQVPVNWNFPVADLDQIQFSFSIETQSVHVSAITFIDPTVIQKSLGTTRCMSKNAKIYGMYNSHWDIQMVFDRNASGNIHVFNVLVSPPHAKEEHSEEDNYESEVDNYESEEDNYESDVDNYEGERDNYENESDSEYDPYDGYDGYDSVS